ncbi:MAG: hypothetical protein KDA96_08000, partial [Planctomycetaceae bacterium]|nr:hypothetical protein [Planctomycetaceae bacterium]
MLVQLCEQLPAHDRWLNEGEAWPAESLRWTNQAFLLSRIPQRFDDWGIRTAWKAPVLVRLAADVDIPVGEQTLLLRTRALGRLWIDGQIVARTQPVTRQPPNGEEPMTPVTEPPRPGVRPAGYHQQEVIVTTTIPSPDQTTATAEHGTVFRRCRVVLELAVGGKNLRTETGEVCVAIKAADGQLFHLLRPAAATGNETTVISLTDAAVEPLLRAQEHQLRELETQTRRSAALSQEEFWKHRHGTARDQLRRQSQVVIPMNAETPHPIDAFLAARIAQLQRNAAEVDPEQAVHFQQNVLPILREQCFRCHGEKDKGGLKLDSRAAALKAGESEIPAVVPGNLEASELIVR